MDSMLPLGLCVSPDYFVTKEQEQEESHILGVRITHQSNSANYFSPNFFPNCDPVVGKFGRLPPVSSQNSLSPLLPQILSTDPRAGRNNTRDNTRCNIRYQVQYQPPVLVATIPGSLAGTGESSLGKQKLYRE